MREILETESASTDGFVLICHDSPDFQWGNVFSLFGLEFWFDLVFDLWCPKGESDLTGTIWMCLNWVWFIVLELFWCVCFALGSGYLIWFVLELILCERSGRFCFMIGWAKEFPITFIFLVLIWTLSCDGEGSFYLLIPLSKIQSSFQSCMEFCCCNNLCFASWTGKCYIFIMLTWSWLWFTIYFCGILWVTETGEAKINFDFELWVPFSMLEYCKINNLLSSVLEGKSFLLPSHVFKL